MRWHNDISNLADVLHCLVAFDDIDSKTYGVVLFQVLVVEDRVTGKDGQARFGLDREGLTAHRVPADIECADAGDYLGGLIVHQNQSVSRFASKVCQDIPWEEDIGCQGRMGWV